MTNQPTACRSTQHCATHGFCHRCAPQLADASRHLVKAMKAAGIEYPASSDLYAQLAATVRDAVRQASGQQPINAECTCIHPPEEDAGQTLHASYCLAAGLSDTQPAVEAHPPQEAWRIELLDVDGWMPSGLVRPDRELVASYLAGRRKQRPDAEFRLVRETTTWTVEEDETR
jgi:hypothetical protein